MRTAAITAVLLLAGCASSPEYVASQSNWDVCRLTMRGPHARNAEIEAQRRGLDCRQYYPAIEAQMQRESAVLQQMIRPAPVPAPMPIPQQTQCTSRVVGNTVQTTCN